MLANVLQGLLLTGETPAVSTIDWSNIVTADSFAPMLSGITSVLPVVVPVGLTIAVFIIIFL